MVGGAPASRERGCGRPQTALVLFRVVGEPGVVYGRRDGPFLADSAGVDARGEVKPVGSGAGGYDEVVPFCGRGAGACECGGRQRGLVDPVVSLADIEGAVVLGERAERGEERGDVGGGDEVSC